LVQLPSIFGTVTKQENPLMTVYTWPVLKKNQGKRRGISFYTRNWFQNNIPNNTWYQKVLCYSSMENLECVPEVFGMCTNYFCYCPKSRETKYTWNHYQVLLKQILNIENNNHKLCGDYKLTWWMEICDLPDWTMNLYLLVSRGGSTQVHLTTNDIQPSIDEPVLFIMSKKF